MGPFRCVYCDRATYQSPARVNDEVYPACCNECVDAGLWKSVEVSQCDQPTLVLAAAVDDLSWKCAQLTWAYYAICAERGWVRKESN